MDTNINERIEALRAAMNRNGISATIIPQTDPHQSEYIADHWQVRRWLSGFTGSAGTLVVTTGAALLWTDSRYFIQAASQLDGTGITLMKDGLPDTPPIEQYLSASLSHGDTVGIDGMLFSVSETARLRTTLSSHGINIDDTFSPIDGIWGDRPSLPDGKIIIHDIRYAGESCTGKIAKILGNVAGESAYSTFISALDEIAWALNIRARDVECNPVATAFLYISPKGSTLFIDSAKVDNESKAYLAGNNISVAPYSSIKDFLASLPETERVLIEPAHTAWTISQILGRRMLPGQSPVAMLKGCKNDIQIQGTREAMQRDGVALVKTFMEIERMLRDGEKLTEMGVARLATHFRSEQPLYFDDSFGTIAGYKAHGAIVHYSATGETDSVLHPDGLLLVDSGAQYLDGTTDITRTVTLGNPTPQERRDFTLVMKGHIALGTMIFPAGTRGAQLDAIARQFLWKEGLSYLHGTGHGVGHFLNVHEGPQSIRLNENPTPLTPGMITSNEPGLYREGLHGIRCENLVLTVPAFTTGFGEFLKFETLTLFPFDLNLFDTSIMTDDEIQWVNSYHTTVRDRLSPLLDSTERLWLEEKTRPLTR